MVEAVEAHVRAFFDGHVIAPRRWSPRRPERVLAIAPGPRTTLWTYASLGACTHGLELVLLAPDDDDLHVELVSMVASYHVDADPSYRLGLGHTVPIGRPWLPSSRCDHVLVSLPYPFGPELERCDGVRILWLVPITPEERAFKIANGLDALEERFEAAALRYWIAARTSVV